MVINRCLRWHFGQDVCGNYLGPLHTRDHFTSTIVIGGKGKVGPSLLHTILEGPMEYMTARWMSSLHGFLHNIEWIMFHGHLNYSQKSPLGGRPNTKLGDHGTPNAHNNQFILLYHVWRLAWIDIHWSSICLRAQSHMTSHYTWGSMTTLHDFGGVLGRPLDTFFWALTMSWSRPLGLCVKWPYTIPSKAWVPNRHMKKEESHMPAHHNEKPPRILNNKEKTQPYRS